MNTRAIMDVGIGLPTPSEMRRGADPRNQADLIWLMAQWRGHGWRFEVGRNRSRRAWSVWTYDGR